jgi:hypothetical protein
LKSLRNYFPDRNNYAATNLKAELKFTELETNFENTQSKQLDEEQTLHDVATIKLSRQCGINLQDSVIETSEGKW